MTSTIVILLFLLIVVAAVFYWSPTQRIKRTANKFVDTYQADVIESCLLYAKNQLTYPEYKRFREIFELKVAEGGMSLKNALDQSIIEAKEDLNGVEADH